MRYGLMIAALMLAVLIGVAPVCGAADKAPADPPKAVFTQMKYEFDKVVDGSLVTHDFAVKNTGSGVLEINQVKTG